MHPIGANCLNLCATLNYAIGAVLGQRFNKQPQVNYYASRTLNNAHQNYFTMEKEFLAMKLTLEKFRSDLIG